MRSQAVLSIVVLQALEDIKTVRQRLLALEEAQVEPGLELLSKMAERRASLLLAARARCVADARSRRRTSCTPSCRRSRR